MSGFIAILNTDGRTADVSLIKSLTDTLRRKGPDQTGTMAVGPISLGHALFRTTYEDDFDNQPATLDQQVWITGSIRIDGRQELAQKLGIGSTLKLDQTPDSSLVLRAYDKWGENFLQHLIGEFAFVLWDGRLQKIMCGKDQFGTRELYYSNADNSIIISNCMHTMLSHPKISSRLNDTAIGGFLLFGDHAWLDRSITAFDDIKTIPPAHVLTGGTGRLDILKYWDLPYTIPLIRYRHDREYTEHFTEIFDRSLIDRMRSPKLSISLSGGLDSSAIAASVMKSVRSNSLHREVKAFTIVYDQIHQCQERKFASLTAASVDIPIECVSGDDHPMLCDSVVTTKPLELTQPRLYLEMQRAQRRFGRVTIGGWAADNLLHSPTLMMSAKEHNFFVTLLHISRLKHLYKALPSIGTGLKTKIQSRRSRDEVIAPYPYPTWLNPDFELSCELQNHWRYMWQTANHSQQISRHALMHRIMMQPEWSMDNLYEQGEFTPVIQSDPFLDTRLASFIMSIPALPWLFNKHILRTAMFNQLPDQIINRPKTPLGRLDISLLNSDMANNIDQWQASDGMEKYISLKRVPNLRKSGGAGVSTYVNLRPLFLNNWLSTTTKLKQK